ncbi:MAG: NTP transferase domain-containing protein [Euryarchaeota archaeon]|nr:NTP transferase domain-containing protein [Euryarchaeota archaeon]
MKAVVLAAGRGERLRSSTPKPLVKLFGVALIDRVIENLRSAGVSEIVVVCSHPEVERHVSGRARVVRNTEVERGGGYSLLLGARAVEGEGFILVMSDHVFDREILLKLVESEPECTTLCIDTVLEGKDIDEATRVLVDSDVVVDMGKGIERFNALDTGVFYCTQEVLEAASGFSGRFSVTDVMLKLASEGRLRALDVSGCYWRDIDTQEELRQAEREMLGMLVKPSDGYVSRHLNRRLSVPISRALVNTPVSPNAISVFSFVLCIASGIGFALAKPALGGVLAQAASVIDGCDGEVARLRGRASRFGGYFDSLLDRYADIAVIAGMIASAPLQNWLVGVLAIAGCYSISYTSAKHELYRIPVGAAGRLMQRDMRLFIIFLGGLLGAVQQTLLVIAVLANAVALLRLYQARGGVRNAGGEVSGKGEAA